ncbi:MAG: response regulator [Candidatus Pacebacteria bacterium]|nr:response regulator [Candidatus Paceibacterota bacterium]
MNKNKKILIIDDEKLIVKAFEDHLKREGYDIEVAYDGEEGLTKAKEFKPDLILLDILMPKVDGITLLRDLKNSSETESIPVVMITNLESKENIDETNKLGSLVYLIKSNHDLSAVSKKIKEIFNKINQ